MTSEYRDQLVTDYERSQRSYHSPLPLTAVGYYSEYLVYNYTELPLYMQTQSGVTCEIPQSKVPSIADVNNWHPMKSRIMIRIRSVNGRRQHDENNPRLEKWSGDIDEINIATSILCKSDVYCKEINAIFSLHPIEEGRHLNSKSNAPIEEVPDTLLGELDHGTFKENMFAVVANCNDPDNSCKYIYSMINGMITRASVERNPDVPNHLSVIYTDENGVRSTHATWDFYEAINSQTPLDLNGRDFYISTNPKTLTMMYEEYTAVDLNSSATISAIKKRAVDGMEQSYKTKVAKLETTVTDLTDENKLLTIKNEMLDAKLTTLKRLQNDELKLEVERGRYAAMSTKSVNDVEASKLKQQKESISTIGTVIKTAAVVIPICVSLLTWLGKRE